MILALLGLLAAKILATSLTMWIGGSGGVFAPSLFMGAMLGSPTARSPTTCCLRLAPAAGAYGLVGMGAVFAAAARAPITAVLIIFELTGDYRIILPLMFAVVVATTLGNALTPDTIYTLKLRRRGIDIDKPERTLMGQIKVGEAIGELPRPLAPEQPLRDVLDASQPSAQTRYRSSIADGTLLGVISAADVEQAIARPTDQPRRPRARTRDTRAARR